MLDQESKRYAHDCDECVFLGRYGEYDLYYCEQKGLEGCSTVIARYGNDGPEYKSGLEFVGVIPALTEAAKRVIERGRISFNNEVKE